MNIHDVLAITSCHGAGANNAVLHLRDGNFLAFSNNPKSDELERIRKCVTDLSGEVVSFKATEAGDSWAMLIRLRNVTSTEIGQEFAKAMLVTFWLDPGQSEIDQVAADYVTSKIESRIRALYD